MTEADARTVDVEDVSPAVIIAPAPAFEDSENLRRKSLIEFDEIHIVPAIASAFEQTFNRRDRSDPHTRWVAACRRPASKPKRGFKAQLLKLVFGHYQAGGGGVILLAGIPRGNDGIWVALDINGAELTKGLCRCIGAIAFVVIENDRIAAPLRDFDRHQMVREQLRFPRGGGL